MFRTTIDLAEPFEFIIGNPPIPIPLFHPLVYATALRAERIVINLFCAHPTWEVILRTPFPFLRQLQLVDMHRGAGQRRLVGVRTDFNSLFPSLTNLRITNISFEWSTLVLPSGLNVLDIDIGHVVPLGSVPSTPELEPASSTPSFSDLRLILSSGTSLRHLSLSGIFASGSVLTPSSLGSIHLPNLTHLSLGGNGSAIDAFIPLLSVPSLTKLYIVSPVWSALQSVPILSSQMGLSSPRPLKLAAIDAGPPYTNTRPSIFFTIMAKPSPLMICLECLDSDSDQWCYMVRFCGVRGIDRLVIRDRSVHLHSTHRPQELHWYNVASSLSDVKMIRFFDGVRWAFALSESIRVRGDNVWPLLWMLDFHIADEVNSDEVVCLGRWLTELKGSGRNIKVRIRGEMMSEANVRPFLVELPESTITAFQVWLNGDSF